MNHRILFPLFSLSILLLFSSCEKEETDTVIPPGAEVTTVTGRVVTTGGVGLPNIKLKIWYARQSGNFLGSVLSRLKATAITDKNGFYRLPLYVADDERTAEEYYYKSYHLAIDFSALDYAEYVMPGDLKGDAEKTYTSNISLESDSTYEANFYLPRKRYLPVTLKGYQSSVKSQFIVYTSMSWGFEKEERAAAASEKPAGSNWTQQSCPIGAFRATPGSSTFTTVPFALHDSTTVTLWRIKEDGTAGFEDQKLVVTDTEPQSLSFDF